MPDSPKQVLSFLPDLAQVQRIEGVEKSKIQNLKPALSKAEAAKI
jgi:hypothetical protein